MRDWGRYIPEEAEAVSKDYWVSTFAIRMAYRLIDYFRCRVCNVAGDSIPGPRPAALFPKISFPWLKVTDAVEDIGSIDAYRWSMLLSREGLICGPSSGMALKGLIQFLQRAKSEGRLQDLADPDSGEISCVFPCADLPYQYMDTYFKKLGEQDFHPIVNRVRKKPSLLFRVGYLF